VALLFQPRRALTARRVADNAAPQRGDRPADRGVVLRAALEAVVLADASHFRDLFTDDVTFTSPHLAVTSQAAMQAVLGVPEDSLSDVLIEVRLLETAGDTLLAEWRLDARFSGPLLFDDNLLIEPTGGRVKLTGASVAEFRDDRICAFRHYFDDSELIEQIPGVPAQLRWRFGPFASPGDDLD